MMLLRASITRCINALLCFDTLSTRSLRTHYNPIIFLSVLVPCGQRYPFDIVSIDYLFRLLPFLFICTSQHFTPVLYSRPLLI